MISNSAVTEWLEIVREAHAALGDTRSGRRYLRIIDANSWQIQSVLAQHPEVSGRLRAGHEHVKRCIESGRFDHDAVVALNHVMDDFRRYGDMSLKRSVDQLREELDILEGCDLRAALTATRSQN